jgi:hypothetical protein
MTDQPDIDPAILTIIAACSDRIQRQLTEAINAEIQRLLDEGHCGQLVITGAVSGASTLLFSIITGNIEIENQFPTLVDSFQHLADALGDGHGALLASIVPEGVTVQ